MSARIYILWIALSTGVGESADRRRRQLAERLLGVRRPQRRRHRDDAAQAALLDRAQPEKDVRRGERKFYCASQGADPPRWKGSSLHVEFSKCPHLKKIGPSSSQAGCATVVIVVPIFARFDSKAKVSDCLRSLCRRRWCVA